MFSFSLLLVFSVYLTERYTVMQRKENVIDRSFCCIYGRHCSHHSEFLVDLHICFRSPLVVRFFIGKIMGKCRETFRIDWQCPFSYLILRLCPSILGQNPDYWVEKFKNHRVCSGESVRAHIESTQCCYHSCMFAVCTQFIHVWKIKQWGRGCLCFALLTVLLSDLTPKLLIST